MIERQFITQKIKEQRIQEFIAKYLDKAGYSHTEIKKTPLGEKIIIYTSRPGLVVGRKGENIRKLTETLKNKFKMENPQIEIGEIENQFLDVQFVADRIVSTFERFGSKSFKSIGYKTLQNIMDAGAIGAEIVISGKVPSARAKSWRFSAGYLKKSGDISESKVKKVWTAANLKSGTIGIKVRIMTPDIQLPDKVEIRKEEIKVEEVEEEPKEETEKEKKEKEAKKVETTKKEEKPKAKKSEEKKATKKK